jgi:hypothetical protein
MAEIVIIAGDSTTGKSTGIHGLDPKTNFVISCAQKTLPFKGSKKAYTKYSKKDNPDGNFYSTSNPETIGKLLTYIEETPRFKQCVLDDAGMLLSFGLFDRIEETGFKKFEAIAKDFSDILLRIRDMRDDLIVFIMLHEEEVSSEDGTYHKRIIHVPSKMIREKLNPERLSNYTFFTYREQDPENSDVLKYSFITGNDLYCAAKSPKGCFDKKYIDNNL